VIGACIWAYENTLTQTKPIYWFLFGASLLALPPLWLLGIRLDPSFVSGLGLAGLFVFALQNARALSHPLLRPLHWVGDWSFALYLLHVPVFLTAIRLYKISGASGFVATLLVALVLSCAVHWLVERPSRRLHHML
jgi:peptidoglycan/LPS O-acetylase OafA/YrhL